MDDGSSSSFPWHGNQNFFTIFIETKLSVYFDEKSSLIVIPTSATSPRIHDRRPRNCTSWSLLPARAAVARPKLPRAAVLLTQAWVLHYTAPRRTTTVPSFVHRKHAKAKPLGAVDCWVHMACGAMRLVSWRSEDRRDRTRYVTAPVTMTATIRRKEKKYKLQVRLDSVQRQRLSAHIGWLDSACCLDVTVWLWLWRAHFTLTWTSDSMQVAHVTARGW